MKTPTLITIIFIISLITSPIYAATPTPDQESTPSGTIDQIIEAVREKVAARLDQIEDRPVGIIGQVTNLTEQSITILVDDQEYSATSTGATTYLKIPGRKEIKREDIALQDYLLIKGTLASTQTMVNASEIQVIPTPDLPERESITGTITKILNSEIQLATEDETTYTLKVTSSTPIKEISDTQSPLKLTDLNTQDIITITGPLSAKLKTQFTSGYIFRINTAQ